MPELTPCDIAALLDRVEPHTLQAVTLLRVSRATGTTPDREARAAATTELTQYTQAADRLADQLKRLPAAPVTDRFSVEAFSL